MSHYIVKITDGLFKASMQKGAPFVFPTAISNFQILANEKWVLLGPRKESFMDILTNKFISVPSSALSYNKALVHQPPKIEQVKFKGVIPTAHLSARYEFFKDEFDQTCMKFVQDNVVGSNNVGYEVSTTHRQINSSLYNYLMEKLDLQHLQDRWTMGLSNGQMRRARLARSLLKQPDIILVDDPFLGLDPVNAEIVSKFLAEYNRSVIVIGLRYQDPIPSWCTHLCFVDHDGISFQGPAAECHNDIGRLRMEYIRAQELHESSDVPIPNVQDLVSPHPLYRKSLEDLKQAPPTIELRGLTVSYKGVNVLENITWQVPVGSTWHIRGANGSGKSTLLSVLTADHPQSWNSKLIENGVPRRTGATSYFDINMRIGMSSPELHAIFLKIAGDRLTVRETIASGLHQDSSNNFKPLWKKLEHSTKQLISLYLNYFRLDHETMFKDLSVSDQKLTLFIRALVKMPQLLILDEAFSAMDSTNIQRCKNLLHHWPGTCLIVSHLPTETPPCDYYLHLHSPSTHTQGSITTT
ncbi:uncharacterized protein Ecym_5557 [Eremothecium cymbalariae DBVPG|uniref:ABC transporter domain-containing protein n=1 Tax=Eremothecium cymbalariae (strain CBS 270.75 / DBVPG 7215 / KCTC 17166 / NRRL Y-17582) TaxID=931890 RepID=I6NE05_ERECY|nr:hypothetical protein Ecym_5557 [Eremothecium cymbalariae DBVPG\